MATGSGGGLTPRQQERLERDLTTIREQNGLDVSLLVGDLDLEDLGQFRGGCERLHAALGPRSDHAVPRTKTPPTPPDTTKPGETTEPTGTTASGATGTTAPEETTIPGEVTGTTEPEETTTPGGSTEPGETTEPGTTTAPGGDLPQTGQLKWPVPVMFGLGVLLSTIGILLRRRDDDA